MIKEILKSKNDSIRLFFPMFIGYIVSMYCKMGGGSGKTVKFRPPSYVFGIVWPILYLLLGLSWVNSYKGNKAIDILFFLLSSFLALWIIVYACMKDKKNAIFVMLAIILTISLLMVQIPKKSQLYLVPLAVWIFFAMLLSTTEIQNN